jgi:HlyD family secretion protein
MEVHGKIDEADVGQLKVGQTAQFTVDAYPDRTFSGQVLQIRKSPEVVQNVVTYTTIVSAPNPDLLLLPGMTAQLRIVVSDTRGILKFPARRCASGPTMPVLRLITRVRTRPLLRQYGWWATMADQNRSL